MSRVTIRVSDYAPHPAHRGVLVRKRKADDRMSDDDVVLLPSREQAAAPKRSRTQANHEPPHDPDRVSPQPVEGDENVDPQDLSYRKGLPLQAFEKAYGRHPSLQDPKLFSRVGGTYAVKINVSDEWDEHQDHQPSINFVSEGAEVWGAYDFGMFEGVMHITERPLKGSRGAVNFSWRGQENGEGDISYDEGNQVGQITFSEGGGIEGFFRDLYDDVVTFSGSRTRAHEASVRYTVPAMKDMWVEYSPEAWEIEKKLRTQQRMRFYEESQSP